MAGRQSTTPMHWRLLRPHSPSDEIELDEPLSDEVEHGFRAYIAYLLLQTYELAQEWVNISNAMDNFGVFNSQFEARHEQVIFWNQHEYEQHRFPDREPSEQEVETFHADPDFAEVATHCAFFTFTTIAQYDRRIEFGWMPNGWLGASTENVALPLI